MNDRWQDVFPVTCYLSLVTLLRFFMSGVFAAATAKLAELQPLRRGFLVFGCDVVTVFTIRTL
jgi:hypothetical protein